WLATALVSRISSLSALVAAGLAAVWAGLLGHSSMMWLATLLATLVFYKHLPNIERIKAGTEPKIGQK
ncbi:MAG: glycerol-3-phosphate acyltransferase, partial [Albidovulum sp.]|uniref:glycerol-3-phosphate acyltransferase n=1 Tax=Albidovulum sp. TaxID=1872424 RepID=UPI003CB92B78